MTKGAEIDALTEAARPLVGKMPDKAVAEALGVKKASIAYIRSKLGVPAFDQERAHQGRWTPENVALLGTMTDSELAAKLNCETHSVFKARKRRGVAPFRQKAVTWESVKQMDQSDFIRLMLENSGLTRRQLAAAACVSHSRLEKWAAPGTGREPMVLYIRRLIFLTAIYTPSFTGEAE